MRSNKVEFQVGVDVLGFPAIVTHEIPDRLPGEKAMQAVGVLSNAVSNLKSAVGVATVNCDQINRGLSFLRK